MCCCANYCHCCLFVLCCLFVQALKCEDWPDGVQPTQVEEDLWYNSLLSVSGEKTFLLSLSWSSLVFLQCYDQLTEWEGLEKAAVANVDADHTPPRLNMIWEDDYNTVSQPFSHTHNHTHTAHFNLMAQLTIQLLLGGGGGGMDRTSCN